MLTIQDVLKNIIDAIQVMLNSSSFQTSKGSNLDSEFKKEIHNYIEDINEVLKTRIDAFSQPQLVQEKPHSTHKFLQAEKNDIHYVIQNLFILIKSEDKEKKLLKQGLYIINNLIKISETVCGELEIIEKAILNIAKITLPEMSYYNAMKDILYHIASHKNHSVNFNLPNAINDSSTVQIITSTEAVTENQSYEKPYQSSAELMRGLLYSLVTILISSTNGQYFLLPNDKILVDEINKNLKAVAIRSLHSYKKTSKNNILADSFKEVDLCDVIIDKKKREQFSYTIDYILAHHQEIRNIIKYHCVKPIKTLLIIKLLLQSKQEVKGNINILEEALIKFSKALSLMAWNDNNDFDTFYQKISNQKLQVDFSKIAGLKKFIVRTEKEKNIDWLNPLSDSSPINKELDGMLKAALTLLRSSELLLTESERSSGSGVEIINKIKRIESALGRDIDDFLLDEVIERGALTNQKLTAENIVQINQVIMYLIEQSNKNSHYKLLDESFLLLQFIMSIAIQVNGDLAIIEEGLLNAAKKISPEAIYNDSFLSLLTQINSVISSRNAAFFQTTFILEKAAGPTLPTSNTSKDNLTIDGSDTDKAINNELAISDPVKPIIIRSEKVKRKANRDPSLPSISSILTGILHLLITITKSSTKIRFLLEQDKRWLNYEINQNVKNLVARTSYSWNRRNNDFSDIFDEVGLSNFIIKSEMRKQLVQTIDFFLTHTENIQNIFKIRANIPIKTLLIIKVLLQSSQEIRGDRVIIEKALVELLTILRLPEGENNTGLTNLYQKISDQQFKIDLRKMPQLNDFFKKMQQIKFIDGNPHLAESELINNNDMQTENVSLELMPDHYRETIEINNKKDKMIIDGSDTDKAIDNRLGINGDPVKHVIILSQTVKGKINRDQSLPSIPSIFTSILRALISIKKSSTNIHFLREQDKKWLNDEINQNIKSLVARTPYSRGRIKKNVSDVFNEIVLSNVIIKAEKKKQLLQAIDFFLTHIENVKSRLNDHYAIPIKTLLILKLLLKSSQEIRGDIVIIEKALIDLLTILSHPEGENKENFNTFYQKISDQKFEIDLRKSPKVNCFFKKMKQIKFLDENPPLTEAELINNNMQTENVALELIPNHRYETIKFSNNDNDIDIDTDKGKNTNNNSAGNTYSLYNYFDGDIQEPARKKRCLNTHKELNEMLDAILTLLRSSELRMIPKERFPSFRNQLINTINKIESALGRDGNNFFLDKIIERGILSNQALTVENIGQINQVISYLIDKNNKYSNDELLNEAFLLTSLIINEPMNIGGNLAIIQIGLLSAAKAILPETTNCDSFSSLIAEINSVALSTTVNGFRLSNLISQAGFFNASNMNDTGSKTFEDETLNKEATIDSQLRSSQ